MERALRFYYVSDVDWWCLHRDGMGLVNYGETTHAGWEVLNILQNECTPQRMGSFDLVRFGSLPVYYDAVRRGVLPLCKRAVLTLASMRDARLEIRHEGVDMRVSVRPQTLDAVVINTQSMIPNAVKLGVPVIYSHDRVDQEFWSPCPYDSDHGGPLRVGWAGSDLNWGSVKNVDIIQAAFAEIDAELVLQRREVEGLLDAEGMRGWYRSLDAYICLNDGDHPTSVPVLEAGMCGVPIITTRTGGVWREIEAIQGEGVIGPITKHAVQGVVSRMLNENGRDGLRKMGADLHSYAVGAWGFVHEAQRVTLAMEALCHR